MYPLHLDTPHVQKLGLHDFEHSTREYQVVVGFLEVKT